MPKKFLFPREALRKEAIRIAKKHLIPLCELLGRSRVHAFSWPRQELYHDMHALGMGKTAIARLMGLGHGSVVVGIRQHEKRLKLCQQANVIPAFPGYPHNSSGIRGGNIPHVAI